MHRLTNSQSRTTRGENGVQSVPSWKRYLEGLLFLRKISNV